MKKRADGRYQQSFTLPDGKRKVLYAKTKSELTRKIAEYRYEESEGRMFESLLDDWWDDKTKHIVPSTVVGYHASVVRARSHFEGQRIKSITPMQCDTFIRLVASDGKSKKTVHTQLCVLSMIFDYAVLHGYIPFNPCASVKVPSGLKSKKRELPSDDDLQIVERSDWLFPFFLLYTGLRRGEALAITYEDIDREKKVIHVTKAIGFDNDHPYLKSTKTESGRRDVILLDKLAARIPNKKHGLLFEHKGGYYTSSAIQREWERWQRANNTSMTAHQLRHGYATILHDAGIDVKDAQYLLGHSSVSMTQDIYTHIRQSRIVEAGRKLNDYFGEVKV